MQDYTIKDFRVGNFEDTNGNTWCTVTFEEYGEPLIWVVKDPEKSPERFALNTTTYGEIKDWTSSKGKTSARFYAKQKDDRQATPASSSSPVKDKPYLKDVTDIPVRFMQSLLQYFDVQTLAKNPTQYENYLTLVKMLSEDALLLIENVRSDNQTTVVDTPKQQVIGSRSLGDEFRNRNEPPPGDEDIPFNE